MDFKVERKPHPNEPKYKGDDFELAKKFVEKLKPELADLLKAAVLFGSVMKAEHPSYRERDIDVLLVINDLTLVLSPEVTESYRVITENIASGVSKRLHITGMKLTSFWEYVRNGDPVIVNVLRDGMPLYDAGFFEPVQHLLFKGKIRPSRESVYSYLDRSPLTLQNAKWHLLQATIDLYWAAIDSAHAALMNHGETPPSPEHVPELLEKKFVNTHVLEPKYVQTMNHLYQLMKMITHRELTEIKGDEFSKYHQEATEFCERMKKLIVW